MKTDTCRENAPSLPPGVEEVEEEEEEPCPVIM
jgi:hypothetical protein